MSHNFGNTTNFQVASTDSFWGSLSTAQQTNVTANANYLLGQVEAAFTTTTGAVRHRYHKVWDLQPPASATRPKGRNRRQQQRIRQPDQSDQRGFPEQ